MSQSKQKLLLVDDEPRILRTLAMIFRNNFEVFTAENGHLALDVIESNQIDVIVSDQRMPGMLGSELLKAVKEKSPDTMRLLLTGYSDLKSIINSINEGEVFRYISKPWDKEKLLETVNHAASIVAAVKHRKQASNPKALVKIPDFLVLDKDRKTHDLIKGIVGKQANVFCHDNIDQAIDTLSKEQVAILITEIRLNNEDISQTINLLKQKYPALITIVITEFSDANSLVDLINHGQVYRFLPKPARKGILIQSIKSGIKTYHAFTHDPITLSRKTTEPLSEEKKNTISLALLNKIKRLRNRSASKSTTVA